ncbi:MAG: hypothetical protein LBU51_08465 [Bacteroidales bacterium]|jgi:membrane-bound ClpP family serine protease|nr:hypothetical protein [Bacteroidales bacterium]
MGFSVIITLIIIGLLCLALEILIIPGGVVGLIGVLMMGGGVTMAYVKHGLAAGNITLIITFVVCIGSIVIILRSKTWRKLMLKTNIDSKVNEIDEEKIQIGMEGIAISRLAPMGKGKFDHETVEVSSPFGFVDVGSKIVIYNIEGNKILVKQI